LYMEIYLNILIKSEIPAYNKSEKRFLLSFLDHGISMEGQENQSTTKWDGVVFANHFEIRHIM